MNRMTRKMGVENQMNRNATVVTMGIAVLALSGLTSQVAVAQDTGWYLGGGLGRTYATIDEDRIVSSLLANGLTTTAFSADDNDTGYKLFAGYQFSSVFALEGGYFDLGTHGFTATTTPAGTLAGSMALRGINLDAVGFLPIAGNFSLLGRVGVNYAEAEDAFAGTGAVNVLVPNPSSRDVNLKVGVGGQWNFSDRVAMRVEYERYRIDDAVGNRGDIDLASVGLLMRFGGAGPAPVRRPAPSPVAAAPIVVVAPAPARSEQYCGILDIQFEVDMNAIQREEEERLASLAAYMTRFPNTTALIEGHTDDVGSAADNLRLSQRRAQSVVDYLATSHLIARSRLSAVGYGETRPLADNQTQEGQRANRRIGAVIACANDIAGLQPLPTRVTMAMLIEFERDRADIGTQYHAGLQRVADHLRINPGISVTVEGHTDNTTPARAMELSRMRAQNVADHLVGLGIARSRVSSEGFGESRRFAYNTSAESRQENRRVNIIFDHPQR